MIITHVHWLLLCPDDDGSSDDTGQVNLLRYARPTAYYGKMKMVLR